MGDGQSDYRMEGRRLSHAMLEGGRLDKRMAPGWRRVYDECFLRSRMPLTSKALDRICTETKAEQDPEPSVQDVTKARIEELRKRIAGEKHSLEYDTRTSKGIDYAGPVVAIVAGVVFGPLGLAAGILAWVYTDIITRHEIKSSTKKIEKYETELKQLEVRNRIMSP